MEEVDVVTRVALVDRDVPEARVVEVAQPLLLLLGRPRFFGRGDVVEGVLRDLLEAPGRVHGRGRETVETGRLDHLRAFLRGDADNVMVDEVTPNLFQHLARVLDEAALRWVVLLNPFQDLLRV